MGAGTSKSTLKRATRAEAESLFLKSYFDTSIWYSIALNKQWLRMQLTIDMLAMSLHCLNKTSQGGIPKNR